MNTIFIKTKKSKKITDNMNNEVTFVNVKAQKLTKTGNSLFKYNDKSNLRSEEVGKEYYESKGYNSKISENGPWISLFYRIFKNFFKRINIGDEFKTHGELILDADFYNSYEKEINSYLNELKYKNLSKIVLTNQHQKFRFHLQLLLDYLNNDQILSIISYLIKDFVNNAKGFPDLIVWNENKLFFCEVKSENDTLSKKQLTIHKIMLKNMIKIEILTINKIEKSINIQKAKYKKEIKPNETEYPKRYQIKLDICEEVLNHFNKMNFNIKEKINIRNPDYIVSYLNAINELNIKTIDDLNNRKEEIEKLALNNENKMEYLRIMSKGKKLESKKRYEESIATYYQLTNNPKRHVALKRICICYRKLKNYDKELSVIFNCINDETMDGHQKDIFRRRLNRFINPKRTKEKILNNKCPKCGKELYEENMVNKKTKFIMCKNKKCYWYGGIKK